MGFLTRSRLQRTAATLLSAAVMTASLTVGHGNVVKADMAPTYLEVTLRPGQAIHETKTMTVR